MKDKALRRAFKVLAGSVGISYYECENGEIGVSGQNKFLDLGDRISRLENRLWERDRVKLHIDNKEPHVCKVCNKETKQ